MTSRKKGNTSSFHAIKGGRSIHGNAAFLYLASQVGGVDGFLKQYGERVMRDALNHVLSEARAGTPPKLSRVK